MMAGFMEMLQWKSRFRLGIFWLCALPCLAIGRDTIPIAVITESNRFFTTDKLQQVYVVTPSNELIKYNSEGSIIFRFNNNTLGDLGTVDVTDPFNLLLYYPDYQVAITLDRTLNLTSETNLWAFDIVNIQTIGTSNDNHLWVYDEVAFKLKKINRSGEELAASDNLNLLLPQTPEPQQILARENGVYLNDPKLGILRFDNFGQFDRVLGFQGIKDFQVRENRLIFQMGKDLVVYDLRAFQEQRIKLPAGVEKATQIRLESNLIYARFPDRVEVYRGW